MVKLVDTPDLGSGASRRVGSSPIRRTKNEESPKGFPRFAFYDIPWLGTLIRFARPLVRNADNGVSGYSRRSEVIVEWNFENTKTLSITHKGLFVFK